MPKASQGTQLRTQPVAPATPAATAPAGQFDTPVATPVAAEEVAAEEVAELPAAAEGQE